MAFKGVFLVLSCFLLAACQNTQIPIAQTASVSAPIDNNQILNSRHLLDDKFTPIEISDSDLFMLTAEQKNSFDEFYFAERYSHLSEPARFSEFLTTRLASFTYDGETYTASQAFETMTGNCLSLAVLTTALANHAGLDIKYQRVDAPPVYEKHGNILLLSTHVRTRVYGPQSAKKRA